MDCSVQDQITWLSQVSHASVDRAKEEDKFGQVRSGLITLKGRLSIVIIERSPNRQKMKSDDYHTK
jgi:hypothetical protein